MNIKARIWLLPGVAAAVFVTGLVVSMFAGTKTSAGLGRLQVVDAPYQVLVSRFDNTVDQMQRMLQSAAAEGDPDKLKDVDAIVQTARKSLDELVHLPGKAEDAAELRTAFEAYQTVAVGLTRAVLNKGEVGDQVQRMQQTQTVLKGLLQARTRTAEERVTAAQVDALEGVRRLLWLNGLTGAVVLLVLGGASAVLVRSVWRDLGGDPEALREAARRVAAGDLGTRIELLPNDATSVMAALDTMRSSLGNVVQSVRNNSESVATASAEIAQGNQDLSVRTEQQASSLEATASTMDQLGETVRRNADSAGQANELAQGAAAVAAEGGVVVGEVVATMKGINDSSRKISDIIGVIDGIAFQTNILALNAAVEAARAGEQGRGFAVVASEVRSLAQRSADAAKEIKTLIGGSVEQVERGTSLVDRAGKTMGEIVGAIQRVSQIVAEISTASHEQNSGVELVGTAITKMDQATQQNAALVEQSAAAAESLKGQARELVATMAVFRLGA